MKLIFILTANLRIIFGITGILTQKTIFEKNNLPIQKLIVSLQRFLQRLITIAGTLRVVSRFLLL
jgi:hypothetical protein